MALTQEQRKEQAINDASLYYSIHMLRLLRSVGVINEDEYERTARSLTDYYDNKSLNIELNAG